MRMASAKMSSTVVNEVIQERAESTNQVLETQTIAGRREYTLMFV